MTPKMRVGMDKIIGIRKRRVSADCKVEFGLVLVVL